MTPKLTRRRLLAASGLAAGAGLAARALGLGDERGWRADVFIARVDSYAADLESVLRDGLAGIGLTPAWARRKSVLLKPNLVEPLRSEPHVNTHPALVRAAAAVFLGWGASEVFVAEGPGHCRDTDLVLEQSGLGEALRGERIDFVDLNYDDLFTHRNASGFTRLRSLHLPASLRRADLVVSMPKLKTHHWVGVTLAMKNLFGLMPGVAYGWPKNVLHQAGIPGSVLDINAAARPDLAIVDGIVGMEGDGPIMGTPVDSGAVVIGTNLAAVDATAARLMRIDPSRVAYLAGASGRLGPIAEAHIRQRGEAIASLARPFALMDHPSLSGLRLPG